MRAKKFWLLAILVVVSSLILGIVAGAQDDRQGAGIPAVGPRGPVGPDVPLSDAEKKQFAKRVVVEGRTAAAVQAACDRAVRHRIPVVFLPDGGYAFEREVLVPGGITILGEGTATHCLTRDWKRTVFKVESPHVRITRLRLEGPCKGRDTRNNSTGIAVAGAEGIRIDHCKIFGFCRGVNFSGGKGQLDHCNIHHCVRDGLGYGISLYSGARVMVADNEFSQCRHSLASNGALDWSSPKRVGKYVHKPGIRKTHWEFIRNYVHGDDETQWRLCAVDTHPGMDGTFVVEGNLFEHMRHGVGIRDGSGIIRGNLFRNFEGYKPVAISISYGKHNGIEVEGTMPRDIQVGENRFEEVETKYRIGKAENITIDGKLLPETQTERKGTPRAIRRLEMMGDEDAVTR